MTIFTKFTPCGTCQQRIPSSLVTLHARACKSRDRRGFTAYGMCALCGHSYFKAQWAAHEASESHRVKLAQAADERLGGDWATVAYWGNTQIGVILELPETRIAGLDGQIAQISMPRETDKAIKLIFEYSYTLRNYAYTAGRQGFWRNADFTNYAVIALYLAPHLRQHKSLPEWMSRVLWARALKMDVQEFGKTEITNFFRGLGFDSTGFVPVLQNYEKNARHALLEFAERSVK